MYNDFKDAVREVWRTVNDPGFVLLSVALIFVWVCGSMIHTVETRKAEQTQYCHERGLSYVKGACVMVLTEAEIGLFFEDY